MSERRQTVIDETGQVAHLQQASQDNREDESVEVVVDDRRVMLPARLLSTDGEGRLQFAGRFEELPTTSTTDVETRRIPVASEKVSVDRRVRPTGKVRVTKRVDEEVVGVDDSLDIVEADVERVAVERVLDAPAEITREGDTIVVPVMAERLVRQLVLVEEVRIHLNRRTESIHEEVPVRRERVEVERLPADEEGEAPPESSPE